MVFMMKLKGEFRCQERYSAHRVPHHREPAQVVLGVHQLMDEQHGAIESERRHHNARHRRQREQVLDRAQQEGRVSNRQTGGKIKPIDPLAAGGEVCHQCSRVGHRYAQRLLGAALHLPGLDRQPALLLFAHAAHRTNSAINS
ncbi:Uncharacterised protein [Mycobacteroides abscessus subsp. abscessus]|nr:Uncharacterised protein [Mycobacteroides abscessus subsp. abscessus]SKU50830.1 Uncharacterised protein [Mycobacteroides abscessus subsp. abscessus]